MNDFRKRVCEELRRIIKSDHDRVAIAVSTGVDSMVLLDIVMECCSHIVVCHVNHGKRPESIDEAEFLKEFCAKHSLELYIEELDLKSEGENFHALARAKRYKFFEDVMLKTNSNILLTAHHGDDLVETVIMRMVRQSSLEGYIGFRKIQTIKKAHIEYLIFRPMIEFSKEEVIEYAVGRGLTFYEDSSNNEDTYTRNRIRHHVVPFMKQENNSLIKAINQYSYHLENASRIVEGVLSESLKKVIFQQFGWTVYMTDIPFDDYIYEQLLFRLLKPLQLSSSTIQELKRQISQSPRLVNPLTDDYQLVKEYDSLSLVHQEAILKDYFLEITRVGKYALPNDVVLAVAENPSETQSKYICYFATSKGKMCYNIQDFPLIVRSKRAGDRYGKSLKLISDYFTAQRIRYLDRERLLVLCDSTDKIIALLENCKKEIINE